jgi:hypothetical protein
MNYSDLEELTPSVGSENSLQANLMTALLTEYRYMYHPHYTSTILDYSVLQDASLQTERTSRLIY